MDIELKERVADLEKITQRMRALYEGGRELALIPEFDKLYNRVLKLACTVFKADGGSIMILDEESDKLVVEAAYGAHKEVVLGKRLKLGERFAGRAAKMKSSLLSHEVEDKSWFKSLRKFENVKSGMSVPLIVKGKLVGVINLKRTRREERFTQKDVELLSLLAGYAAATIENARLHHELRTLDKLKTDFTRISAHELKTPLSHVIGYLDILRADKSLSPATRKAVEVAYRAVLLERKLVDDILDIVKLEGGVMRFEMRRVKLADLIRDSVEDAKTFAEQKGVTLKARLPLKLPPVEGDPGRLAQALANLIDNAIKFTERGGVTVEARAEQGNVVVEVRDTGIGIGRKNIPKLFTKFFQADASITRKYGGTGLGLAICKEIVQAHRGKVWAKSRLREGSTFGFSLPTLKK